MKSGKKTLFVCDRIAIIQQTLKRFMLAGLDIGILWRDASRRLRRPHERRATQLDIGILWRDASRHLDAPVLIASSQTVQSRGMESVGDRFLAVIDEPHIDRKTSRRIIDHVLGAGGFAVGLTGTPLGRAVAGRWDAMVSGPTTSALADRGYAVVPEMIQRWSPDEDDLRRLEVDAAGEYSAGGAARHSVRRDQGQRDLADPGHQEARR